MKPHLNIILSTEYPPIITFQVKHATGLWNKITLLAKAKGWSPRDVVEHAISVIYHEYEIERLSMEKHTVSIES